MSHDSAKEQRLGSSDGLSDAERWEKERLIKVHGHDFGFTLEEPEKPIVRKFMVDSGQKAKKIYDLIMPLLLNLSKDETKDVIKWPGKERTDKIGNLIYKINKIMDREEGVEQNNE